MTVVERAQLVISSVGGGGRRYTCSELESRGVLLIPTQIYYGMAFLAMPAQIKQGRRCTFILILESCSNSSEPSLLLSSLWLLRTYKFLSGIFSKPYTTR